MDILAMFTSALSMILASVIAFYLLGRAGANFSRRLPCVLELSVPLFLLGLAMLPEALPSVFASILHHTILSDCVHPTRGDGTQVTETWILARWWTPISRIFYESVIVGIIWGAWNIFRAQDRKLNILTLCLGLVWVVLGAFANLRVLPF
jgi:hypothetical protein